MGAILRNVAIVIALAFSVASFAGPGAKVDSWFNNMNYSNITNPGVVEGQSGRYATLGGISARAPITQPFNFASIQTPRFSAGCGGIDFYAGGFSAIDSDQLIENLRAIGQNAQSLAFMLAIQIVSPQLSTQLERVQGWANKYLNMNMDSCEAATALVGGTMEMFGTDSANCTIKRMQDFGEDYNTANNNCTTNGGRNATQASGGDPNVIDFVKGNLAWYILMQDSFFSSDPDFAEVMMNITGTIIIGEANTDEDSPLVLQTLAPALTKDASSERADNIFTAFLYGNDAVIDLKIFGCSGGAVGNPDGCDMLDNSLSSISPSWQGLFDRVDTLLESIVNKIKTDSALTAAEKGLISSVEIPIYRYLSAASSYFPNGTQLTQMNKQYTEIIAANIMYKSINAVLEQIEHGSGGLPKGMSDGERVKEYRAQLLEVRSGLNIKMNESKNLALQYVQMMEEINNYEKQIMTNLNGGIKTAAMWGK